MCGLQQQICRIERLKPYCFTFELWRAGSIYELGLQCREWSIKENKNVIRKHAVGFLESDNLWIRPKEGCVAVMFFIEDRYFWTHLTRSEFDFCFKIREA